MPEHSLLRLDLKDFFMSGLADEVANTIADILPVEDTARRKLTLRVLELLLQSQFVTSNYAPGEIYKVEAGTRR
jgi:hypothetical protein